MRLKGLIIPLIVLGFPLATVAAAPVPTKPENARPATVRLWSAALMQTAQFDVLERDFMNGGTLASGDVDGDGATDFVVGSGPGHTPEVRIFKTDGTSIGSFRAYPEWFTGGVRVAVADLDGDGNAEIVTAPGPGIEPQINVFHADGSQMIKGGVWAYAKGFLGGVHVAVGDLDGDGTPEIVTTPGPGGGPHVRVWNERMALKREFFAYGQKMADGVTVTVARHPNGGDIVTGVESWSAPLVRRFSGTGMPRGEFYGDASSSRTGINVAAVDMDGDGTDEIITSSNGSHEAMLHIFSSSGQEALHALLMDASYRGALSVAPAPGGLASLPVLPAVQGPLDREKSITVDLLQQRLYAYEHGRVARTFLISSGVSRHPTPEMEVSVVEKIPVKRYKWYYGPGSPDNYDLPNVKWNLRILGPYHIHYAYWHNNFGHRMSHGCINVGAADAEWIYNWSEVGTHVSVVDGNPTEHIAKPNIRAADVMP